MQLGMIGLGRMGSNLVRRLLHDGEHECVVYDRDATVVKTLADEGATGVGSVEDLAAKLTAPRAVWVMVPAGAITDSVIDELARTLEPGDTVINGGNSYYRDDMRQAERLAKGGIRLLDCGTRGAYGAWSVTPGVGAAARTPGRDGEVATAERGYLHCGPSGSGHFVKMVHNGIEYGMMASIAEGLNILHKANIGTADQDDNDAETAPLADPQFYRYDLDLPEVAEVWRRGSVIGSWLIDLTAAALRQSPDLADYTGRVSDSGEGRWTAIAAIEEGVPAPVLAAALDSRFTSRHLDIFADRALSALRKQFGGHDEKLLA